MPVTLIQLESILYDNSYNIIKATSHVCYWIIACLNVEIKLEKKKTVQED